MKTFKQLFFIRHFEGEMVLHQVTGNYSNTRSDHFGRSWINTECIDEQFHAEIAENKRG